MKGRASALMLSLAVGACGDGPTTPAIVRTGSIGGLVIERSAQGDRLLPGRTFVAWDQQQRDERRLVTDSEGRYRLTELTPGSYVWLNVKGSSTGYPWSHCAVVVVATDGHIDFDVVVTHDLIPGMSVPDPPGFRTISGVVYESTPLGRSPLAAALVDFGLTSSTGGTRRVHFTLTDSQGRFRLCGLPENVGGVVIASDFETREAQAVVSPGPSTSIDIDLF